MPEHIDHEFRSLGLLMQTQKDQRDDRGKSRELFVTLMKVLGDLLEVFFQSYGKDDVKEAHHRR